MCLDCAICLFGGIHLFLLIELFSRSLFFSTDFSFRNFDLDSQAPQHRTVERWRALKWVSASTHQHHTPTYTNKIQNNHAHTHTHTHTHPPTHPHTHARTHPCILCGTHVSTIEHVSVIYIYMCVCSTGKMNITNFIMKWSHRNLRIALQDVGTSYTAQDLLKSAKGASNNGDTQKE